MPAIVAHLWQSTLFAGAAWLFALALGRNRAQVRYWVWFAASAKFLVPFSLLVGIGALLPRPAAAPPLRIEWAAALQDFSQPLALSMPAQAAGTAGSADTGFLQAAALVLWSCGFAAVAICWLLRWRRVQALRRSAYATDVPAGLQIPVPVMSAPEILEPGVFGILRPVLLLPEGIRERLNHTQLDAILAHEFCHLRRRDNLTAAIHMAVQAIFWFHPLTWWIGARLVDERERACDEDVLRLGHLPAIYAESILAVCKLYLSSSLACVAGVTGSDLKGRIEAIMRNRSVARLTPARKLALAVAGVAALVLPVGVGILNTPAIRAQDVSAWQKAAGGKMSFEVASVKLNTGPFVPPAFPLSASDAYRPTGGYFRADFPLTGYVQFAYKIWPNAEQTREVRAHLPAWAFRDFYSIDARAPGNPTKDQMRLMMQSLLAERFKLAAHFETREVPVFVLTLVKAGKLGPKLIPHADGPPCDRPGPSPGRGLLGFPPGCDSLAVIRKANGALMLAGYRNATMEMVANSLSVLELDRPVVDQTGLSGRFDYTIEWAPEPTGPPASASPAAVPPEPLGATAVPALRDQLGLKLESTKAPFQILVIDHLERPTEN
ncbi:MAG TPA: M56 family metallopeptidase [Bryobacteraceae bacterium]|nr:M56 family metallopeptidase [Bryobacteraceae bacterium]